MHNNFRSEIFVMISVILIPAMILFIDGTTVTLVQLNVMVYSSELSCFYMCASAIWMCCCPWRGSCRIWWQQVLFCLVPTELFLLLIFSQYHFKIAAALLSIWVAACAIGKILIRRSTRGLHPHGKAVRAAKRRSGRFCVTLFSIFMAVPSFFSLFIYHTEDPVYKANQEMLEQLELEYQNHLLEADDVYEANTGLFACFEEEKWNTLDSEERITVIQALVDFECEEVLGAPTVTVFSESIVSSVLGYYDRESENICINLDLLENADVEECLHTVCHESFHVYQNFLIESIDWDADVSQTYYFDQAREWLYNTDNYVPGSLYTLDSYADQDLEASAEEFGEEETERILSML